MARLVQDQGAEVRDHEGDDGVLQPCMRDSEPGLEFHGVAEPFAQRPGALVDGRQDQAAAGHEHGQQVKAQIGGARQAVMAGAVGRREEASPAQRREPLARPPKGAPAGVRRAGQGPGEARRQADDQGVAEPEVQAPEGGRRPIQAQQVGSLPARGEQDDAQRVPGVYRPEDGIVDAFPSQDRTLHGLSA